MPLQGRGSGDRQKGENETMTDTRRLAVTLAAALVT
jgi:hypothetical protein